MTEVILKKGDWIQNAGIVGMSRVFDAMSKKTGKSHYQTDRDHFIFDTDDLENFSEEFWTTYFEQQKHLVAEYTLLTQTYPTLLKIDTTDPDKELTDFESKAFDKFKKQFNEKFGKLADYDLPSRAIGNAFAHYPDAKPEIDDVAELVEIFKLKDKDFTPLDKIKWLQENQDKFNMLCHDDFVKYLTITKIRMILWNSYMGQGPVLMVKGFSGHMIIEFQKQIDSLVETYTADPNPKMKPKDNTTCARCNHPIEYNKTGVPIYNTVEFNTITPKKKSTAWNNANRDGSQQCTMCQLTDYAAPLALNIMSGANNTRPGIFINQNISIDALIKQNKELSYEIFTGKLDQPISYNHVLRALYSANRDFSKESSDLQVIKLDLTNTFQKYTHTTFTPEFLQFITQPSIKQTLNGIKNASYQKYDQSVYVLDLVIDHLVNHQHLDDIIIDMLYYRNKYINQQLFNAYIYRLVKLNIKQKGEFFMSQYDKKTATQEREEIATKMAEAGNKLGATLYDKGFDNKIHGISHRLLMILRARDKEQFMDTLIHTYLTVDHPMPREFATMTKETFTDMGYAFLTGFTSINPSTEPIESIEQDLEEQKKVETK